MRTFAIICALAIGLGGTVARAAPPPGDGPGLYAYHCAPCHAAGPGHPGTAALQLKYRGQVAAVLADRRDLTAEAVRYFIRNGVNAMPYFRKTEISDRDITAIAGYMTRDRK